MSEKQTEPEPSEENIEELEEKLREIKKQEGIIGYILRSKKSASIDLKDPTKMIDYAFLSSSVFDTSQNVTEDLQIGEADTMIIESEKTKILSMSIDNHRLSIFMKKDVNDDKLYNRLK